MTIADGSAPAWYETFAPFGLTHLLVVLVSGSLIVWASRRGKRRFGKASERRFCQKWVLFVVCTQLVHLGFWFQPERFDIAASLPLQMCDLAPWIAAAALTWNARWLRTLLYFWGIGLSTQAFVTPVLESGIGTLHFWLFWVTHLQIVGSAVYDVAARGYRPAARDFLTIVLANAVYTAAVMGVNLGLDANYGYIGDVQLERPTLIDALGPWPLRVLWVSLIVHSGMLLMWLAWPAAERLRTRERPDA